jgi:hypothetical protein
MTLSQREQRVLSSMDRALSADSTLQAVLGLFPLPPAERVAAARRPTVCESLQCPSKHVVLAIVLAIAGLLCCAVAAPLDLPFVAAGGVVLAAGAGIVLLRVIRHGEHPRTARRSPRHDPIGKGSSGL